MAVASSSSAVGHETTPVRVLIVDDSAYVRLTLSRRLNEQPGLEVIGTAQDGREALAKIPHLRPDVVTLDVAMPQLDGIHTLREIMHRHPLPVIMFSTLTTANARETIRALMWGAVDFVTKPTIQSQLPKVVDELTLKIRAAAQARLGEVPAEPEAKPKPPSGDARAFKSSDKIVVIGASTGGPRALSVVLSGLPADLPATLLLIQHMPKGFTRSLAERLDAVGAFAIKEAEEGDVLQVGQGFMAPGGSHLLITKQHHLTLSHSPLVHGVRPAIDVTMASVAQHYPMRVVGVVLTGMGSDGLHGATLINGAGGRVIAEAESTSVIWSMPRRVAEAGVAHVVAPLPEVARAITRAVTHQL